MTSESRMNWGLNDTDLYLEVKAPPFTPVQVLCEAMMTG